ncbi:hypothetical protein DSM104299_02466 [Baekduia alba]|uniref:hypothetical protein n=1 Tax=Baekduia alba TaxID=2997333 RepID=UPI00233FF243|nr:hypothetical protein [Baekduia alba]WCB93750.1 hypothetical protein DSM104299_02466 [Baekduia alba]
MLLRRLPAVLAAAAAVAVPTAAQADAPWSAPATLSAASVGVAPGGAITQRGTAAVAVTGPGGTATAPQFPTHLIRLDAGGAVAGDDGLTFADAHLASYGATGLIAAGSSLGTAYPGTIDDTSHIRFTTASGTGAIKTSAISGTTGLGVAAIAGDAQGNVALVAFNTKERVVYLRTKGSSTFSKVLTIKASDRARGATVAVGGKSGGELLVVWEDQHEVYARHRGARSWGATHTLGAGIQSDLSAVIDGSGRESVAWKSQRVSEGESDAPAIVSFITAAPGKGFGARRQIESVGTPAGAGTYIASPGVLLRAIDGQRTLLAWSGFSDNYVVRAETITNGHLGTPAALSPAGTDAILGDAATTPSGAALVLWRAGVRGNDPSVAAPRVFGSVAAPSSRAASFGAPAAISAPDAQTAQPPVALLDASTGKALAAWANVSGPAQVAARPAP